MDFFIAFRPAFWYWLGDRRNRVYPLWAIRGAAETS
jgi:hypothetical protein